MSYNVGVVGATGAVGEVFLKLLNERKFPVKSLKLFASDRSAGNRIDFQGKQYVIETLKTDCFNDLDMVFFSSGDEISKQWGPEAVKSGAFAIDNSAAFRMDPKTPLVVPEVNAHLLPKKDQPMLIANPNCSTIQLVVALAPLHKSFGVERVNVASYQAVSGAGKAAKQELLNQLSLHLKGEEGEGHKECFPHLIAFNALPQIGSFNQDGFCSEEMKIMNESKKILDDQSLKMSAFTVRVPSLNGHAEAAWVTLKENVDRDKLMKSLEGSNGIEILDNPAESEYPHVRMADGKNPVYIGRIHKDLSDPNTWILWIVADNLRKGAALNGIQIAEHIFDI